MSDRADYLAAVAKAEANKLRFLHNAEALKDRVRPSRLKADAKAKVKKAVRHTKARSCATVRQHPLVVGLVGAGLFAFLFRRPIASVLRRLTTRKAEPLPPPPVDTPPIVTALPVSMSDPDPAIAAPAAPPVPETSDEE